MTATSHQIDERRAQAAADLSDVEEQFATGELDQATASKLRARYQAELASLAVQEETVPRNAPQAGGRSLRRAVAGTVLVVAAIIGIVFLVAQAIDDRSPGDFVTGNIESRDLSEVSTVEMEQVVADFPNVIGMRLALARRYFQAQNFSEALPHYFTVLDQDPTNSEALANLGWMTFLADPDESSTAAAYLERSLAADPSSGDTMFYLANVRLYGLDDPGGARELLGVLAAEDLPADVAVVVEEMLLEAGP